MAAAKKQIKYLPILLLNPGVINLFAGTGLKEIPEKKTQTVQLLTITTKSFSLSAEKG